MNNPNMTEEGVLLQIFRAFAESSNESITPEVFQALSKWTGKDVRSIRIQQVFAYDGLHKKPEQKVLEELRALDLIPAGKWD